jgi:hypothetical protein
LLLYGLRQRIVRQQTASIGSESVIHVSRVRCAITEGSTVTVQSAERFTVSRSEPEPHFVGIPPSKNTRASFWRFREFSNPIGTFCCSILFSKKCSTYQGERTYLLNILVRFFGAFGNSQIQSELFVVRFCSPKSVQVPVVSTYLPGERLTY